MKNAAANSLAEALNFLKLDEASIPFETKGEAWRLVQLGNPRRDLCEPSLRWYPDSRVCGSEGGDLVLGVFVCVCVCVCVCLCVCVFVCVVVEAPFPDDGPPAVCSSSH